MPERIVLNFKYFLDPLTLMFDISAPVPIEYPWFLLLSTDGYFIRKAREN
jgi:hypothetical protein